MGQGRHATKYAHAEAEHEVTLGGITGQGWAGAQPPLGSATLQLIDLAWVGAVSSKPGQALRMLATLRYDNTATLLNPDDIFLPAGHFVGEAPQGNPRWTKGECYLMSFYIQGNGKLWQCDVLLTESVHPPMAHPTASSR